MLTELESNSDLSMDSRPDSTKSSSKDKIVPNDVRAWTIDEKYGNMTTAIVDTLHHGYMNTDHPEGLHGTYSTLGNFGSPRQSRIYVDRPMMTNFLFTDPFDMFFTTTERFKFYNTKSPFMNIDYKWCGSKQTGDDHVKVTYTNNAGKRINLGGIYEYLYGRGFYDNQSTSFMNASVWTSYLGERYNFHFYFQHNFMKMGENGGIADERYITNPEDMSSTFASNDIPTNLNQTWNRQEHDVLFFNHHYNIGYEKTVEIDSVKTKQVFVPVTKLFHTLKLQKMSRNYRSYQKAKDYHTYEYLPGDSAQDRTKYFSVKNIVGLSMCEGFNKWAVFGLNAYLGVEYNRYSLPDSVMFHRRVTSTNYPLKNESESIITIGGQIIREQSDFIKYNVDADFVVAGAKEYFKQFEVKGHGEANIPLLGDTAQVAVNAFIRNQTPSYYFRHYHSKHAWWDIDAKQEFRQHVEGIVTVPHTKTILKASFDNIKNLCYFVNDGSVIEQEKNTIVTNNIAPKQYSGAVQVVTFNLKQNFRFGILNFENDVTYQLSGNKDVLPLPQLITYNNLYIKFRIAKVLSTELGGDLKYFTSYYAPDYSPVLGQFTTQNEAKRVKIGNYPILSAYANFELKRARFYVQYYHANQGTGRYFWAPNYPVNPVGIHFGLSWNFYD